MAPLPKSDDDGHVTALSSRTNRARDRAQYRPTAEQKELLIRAAGLTGQTLSDFMRTAVEERAQRVIADPGQNSGIGDLVAVQMQDGQHRAILRRV